MQSEASENHRNSLVTTPTKAEKLSLQIDREAPFDLFNQTPAQLTTKLKSIKKAVEAFDVVLLDPWRTLSDTSHVVELLIKYFPNLPIEVTSLIDAFKQHHAAALKTLKILEVKLNADLSNGYLLVRPPKLTYR